ncbi:YceI family protein [Pseudoalteromonas sp.]|uniref:YceI family protein n=1 Tax=Pseudoalteromonas sp. TaxID=53249 RepID=UPI00272CD781|nr:YceI family protein [Pseudoalteromonas sp.]
MFKSLAITALSLSSLFVAPLASANWQVNNEQSNVSFVSIKKNAIAEAHHFKNVSGTLNEQGQFKLMIDLTSVETLIPIRNERMTKLLFETAQFPNAVLTADLSQALSKLVPGQHVLKGLKAELDFHGNKKELTLDVLANISPTGDVTVSSFTPVIINAADFKVTEGIAELQKLAGLPSIATAVPVTFSLTLDKEK